MVEHTANFTTDLRVDAKDILCRDGHDVALYAKGNGEYFIPSLCLESVENGDTFLVNLEEGKTTEDEDASGGQ